jgi:hypothetical protein
MTHHKLESICAAHRSFLLIYLLPPPTMSNTAPKTALNSTGLSGEPDTHAIANTSSPPIPAVTANPFHNDHAVGTASTPGETAAAHVDSRPEYTQFAPQSALLPSDATSPISAEVSGSPERATEPPVQNNTVSLGSPPAATSLLSQNAPAWQASPTTLPEQTPATPVSPQLATLRSMFPDFDDGLLQSVLDSVGNDEAQAIDALLGMSDPEYKPETRPVQHAPMTQTELDEQFARQLMLQDQQRDQAQWQAHHQQPPQHLGGQPPWSGQQQQQQTPGAQRDTMTEFQDQFNKFAETGKKTIGTFFNKVKAKINELDQPRPPNAGQSSQAVPAPQRQQSLNQQPISQQPLTTQSRAQRDNDPPWIQEAEQYGHPQHGNGPSHDISLTNNQSLGGYDVSSASYSAPTNAFGTSTSTPPPLQTNSGSPIDASKIGLLPKRPVSLIGNSAPTTQRPTDSDDELEYAESPFEERRPSVPK